MIAAERLERISTLLRDRHVMSIVELSDLLNVSEMTVRRDLAKLEQGGLCRRTRGGALALLGTRVQDIPYNMRQVLHVAEKIAIGRKAAECVQEGETVAIDGGTTTSQMAMALRGRHRITAITNSSHVLSCLCDSPGIKVIATGGTVSSADYEEPGRADPCMVGPLAAEAMRSFRTDKAFMATTGLTLEDGLSNDVLEQAEVKRIMIEGSADVFLLADHTKFGHVASTIVGPVAVVKHIITDSGISTPMRHALEKIGIEVMVVEPATDVDWAAVPRPILREAWMWQGLEST